ncbi:hypothetical protein BDZ94DRAFT_1262502 [Collybia nuda]|uniref:Uncharacterized protein n=1 Tax=Collybia nuda TaxID=64659 RepID=A0A9P6CDN0_9AGAR|nr:hypothetical protein BDZ94DRAFT_1262502 [Collybia nuda]
MAIWTEPSYWNLAEVVLRVAVSSGIGGLALFDTSNSHFRLTSSISFAVCSYSCVLSQHLSRRLRRHLSGAKAYTFPAMRHSVMLSLCLSHMDDDLGSKAHCLLVVFIILICILNLISVIPGCILAIVMHIDGD